MFTLLIGVFMAQSLVAQQSWTIGNKTGTLHTVGNSVPSLVGQQFRGTAPVNDECTGAVVVDLAIDGSVPRTGDNTGATDSYGFGNDVWEAFTTTECADVTVSYCGTDPSFGGAFTNLFVGCPLNNLVFIGENNITTCGDGNYELTFPQLPPGTYYYGVLQANGSTGAYEVTFSAVTCSGTPPANDDCGGAVSLTPSPVCTPVAGDGAGATISGGSNPGPSCGGSDASDDVWYSFVATSTDHAIVVAPSEGYDAVVELRDGDCAGSTSLACQDEVAAGGVEQLDASGLTIGTTYFVRVYDWLAGAPLTSTFTICVVGPVACEADAGTIVADESSVCLVGGTADLSATPDGNSVVPVGYETIYVLTQGAGLLIVDAAAAPIFSVTAADTYTIHTLVYDPLTLDLGTVEFGVTTGFDVNALLIQGGGTICASLDVAGAPMDVTECIVCDAVAGTITADEAEVCLVAGLATLSATPDGNSTVPVDFSTVYVLTQGPELLIIDAAVTPSFDVTSTGSYTIHTLIYDPNTLDLGTIEFGVTTGFDVNALLIQGGGTVCGSLDVTGAPVTVINCIVCDQNAGTITADASTVCLVGGTADISATPDGNSVVPVGYETLYVLTQGAGLVIINADAAPAFTITTLGDYTIHTLVYDPLTLDLGSVEFGVTTGFDVNALLVQGGGTICASLDVTGAPVAVQDCTPANDDCGDAINIPVNAVDNCPANTVTGDNTYSSQDGVEPGCDGGSGDGYADVWYTFNSGTNTSVTVNFENVSMADWAITITEGCGGTEVYCEVNPTAPIELTTTAATSYVVRIYSNLDFGGGGEFTLCVSGAEPTIVCDGGDVQTSNGETLLAICQDVNADVVDFTTTSASGENYAFVLTDESNIIVTVLAGNSLDFNSAALGNYRVWGISYNGDLVGADPGVDATTVTSTGACIELSAGFVAVSVEICSGVNELTSAAWGIFPNPGNGDITLNYTGSDATTVVEVVDMGGRIVHQERVAMVNGQQYPIMLAGKLAQGIYSVRLTNASGRAALRMVVR
ncbi:MAG: T9SS type A sorting domain-containing protein [Flavobacteriales bacterium]|nr:T9SS type A sorting domain-containing protein [Flavobacteriales bacterium]